MGYISLDLETTGLDPDNCQIVEIGAVIDDLKSPLQELPHFQCLVYHERLQGEPRAIAMHGELFKEMFDQKVANLVFGGEDAFIALKGFIELNSSFILPDKPALFGKNFANFDLRFLRRVPGWHDFFEGKCNYRIVDPAHFYWDHVLDGCSLPDMKTCLQRAKLEPQGVEHRALPDAMDIVRLVRRHLNIEV